MASKKLELSKVPKSQEELKKSSAKIDDFSNEKNLKEKNNPIVIGLIIFLLGIVIGVFSAKNPFGNLIGKKTSPESSQCRTIAKVKINPSQIVLSAKDPPLELSALAYDASDEAIFSGVNYEWGMSSTTGVGTLRPNKDLATFIPQKIGKGDLFVKAANNCTKELVIGSIPVTVEDENIVKDLVSPTGAANEAQ
jgi:hypothetical protein